MSGLETFYGVFGEWNWEFLDDDGIVVRESSQGFETLAECLADAKRHGYGETPQGEVRSLRATLRTAA